MSDVYFVRLPGEYFGLSKRTLSLVRLGCCLHRYLRVDLTSRLKMNGVNEHRDGHGIFMEYTDDIYRDAINSHQGR